MNPAALLIALIDKLKIALFGPPQFKVDFNQGPCLEITSRAALHRVVMRIDDSIIHEDWITGQHWTRANIRYFANWEIDVYTRSGKCVFSHRFDLRNKRIRINIDSKSLGDGLAWVPQVQRFAEIYPATQIHVAQFLDDLFDPDAYSTLTFIAPDSVTTDCYATCQIGFYFENTDWSHPEDPRLQPLAKVATDILGIPYQEQRPVILNQELPSARPQDPYICIATASTASCKFWHYPNGWQTIIDQLNQRGFQVVVIQKEKTEFTDIIDQTGDHPLARRIDALIGCHLFIGLGSGLSWLAWALNKPVVLISGFSLPYAEFESNCERVLNQAVCHGCWNDTAFVFERDNWDWCPRQENTPRQFECSKLITPKMVLAAIDRTLTKLT